MTLARDIAEALGGTWHGNYGMALCPAHDNTKTPALSISTSEDGKLLAHCHAGCCFEEVMAGLEARGISTGQPTNAHGTSDGSDAAVVSLSRKKQEGRAKNIWLCTQPIEGSPAEAYLSARGLENGNRGNLRYAPHCHHPSGDLLPAMVALIEGSDGFAVHCTYLDVSTCNKADATPQKAMVGPVKGGAVRLVLGEGGLIVAEGIETCLAAQSGLASFPFSAWAALSASGMRSLRLPPDPSALFIASDGDAAGRQAAYELGERARALGWKVFLVPAPQGKDWNDVLMEGKS